MLDSDAESEGEDCAGLGNRTTECDSVQVGVVYVEGSVDETGGGNALLDVDCTEDDDDPRADGT